MAKRTIRKWPEDQSHVQGRKDERIIICAWLVHIGLDDLASEIKDEQHYDWYFRGRGRRVSND